MDTLEKKVFCVFILFTSIGSSVQSSSGISCSLIGDVKCMETPGKTTNDHLNINAPQVLKERAKLFVQRKKQIGQVKMSFPQSVTINSFENATLWAGTEEIIFQLAKLRHQSMNEEMMSLRAFTRDYESSVEQVLLYSRRRQNAGNERGVFVASSGIASYRMTYRYVHILQRLKESMAINQVDTELHHILWQNYVSNSAEGNFHSFIKTDSSQVFEWPNRNDLDLAMHSLIQIQEVYNYDYKQLPFLLSPETTKCPQLNAFHSAQIALHAMYRKYFTVAIEFLEYAVEKVRNHDDHSIPLITLESHLELTAKMHNQALRSNIPGKTFIENLFIKPAEPFKRSSINNVRISSYLQNLKGGSKEFGYESVNFNGICSGKDYRTPQEISDLYCWYDRSSSAARMIQPYKKELLSVEPPVVQVYDFVEDKLISALVNDKTNCTGISQAFDKAVLSLIMRFRTPTTCWPEHSKLERFWRKISSLTLTDLSTDGSHTVGSVDYLYGRFYNVHRDALQSTKENPEIQRKLAEHGDRLFSLVVYLNDVKAGGWTPFPTAGNAALPIKGSVVFWTNLYRNGSAREDTWHGACPVTYGHKQVAVVLLRSNSQFLTYPCTLDRNE